MERSHNKALKEMEEDISAKSQDGRNPMHEAAYHCRFDVIKALKEIGAGISAKMRVG